MICISSIQDQTLRARLQCRLVDKAWPHRSPGQLGEIAMQLGLIQRTELPELRKPHLLVFAADHGVAAECISTFPQSATRLMVCNILDKRTATNAICAQNGLEFRVVDAGINADLPPHPLLVSKKVGYGTRNLAIEAAMCEDELDACLVRGADTVNAVVASGTNIVFLCEAGVGSTTAAAALMHALTRVPVDICVGAGSGVGQLTQARKKALIGVAMHRLPASASIRDILCAMGGFEIAMLAGAIVRAAELRVAVVIDGFVTAVAALIASRLHPAALDYCIFSDVSDERGHRPLLSLMDVRPLLPLSLHRGEGMAAALVYPIIAASCALLRPSPQDMDLAIAEEIHG